VSYPDTPIGAEEELRRLSFDLDDARMKLRDARNAEVAREMAYRKARRAATLSAECPKVRRGHGSEPSVTVAERDAWVEQACEAEEFDLAIATATRQAAGDLLRTLQAQASIQQTVSRSVMDSFRMSSGQGR